MGKVGMVILGVFWDYRFINKICDFNLLLEFRVLEIEPKLKADYKVKNMGAEKWQMEWSRGPPWPHLESVCIKQK